MFSNELVIDSFLVHSESATTLLLYLISIDLHKYAYNRLNIIDEKYVEIERLNYTRIHYGVYISIEYEAVFGYGYKLPRIYYNKNNE